VAGNRLRQKYSRAGVRQRTERRAEMGINGEVSRGAMTMNPITSFHPGMFAMIPVIDSVVAMIDGRIQTTTFNAEQGSAQQRRRPADQSRGLIGKAQENRT
jgi:hypothetical protein